MYKVTPIICPHCNKESGYTQEGIRFLVILNDLLCKRCHKAVILANNGVKW